MRRQLPVAGVLALSLIGLPATANAASAPDSTPQQIDRTLLEEKLEVFQETSGLAVIAEVRVGDETWSEAAGPRSAGWPPRGRTDAGDRFRIGSITKSMVSTVVLQLEAEGELDLDGTVSEHLPGLLPYDEDPTVRQLLNHTGGLFDHLAYLYPSLAPPDPDTTGLREGHRDYYSPEELVEIGTQDPILFEPGTAWSYSNAAYIVLGLLVEEVTGERLRHELRDRVFRPAGMEDSYLPPGHTRGIWGKHPVPYVTTGDADDPLFDTDRLSNSQFWAAGGAVSTVEDLNDFYTAFFDGTLLPEAQLEAATEFVDTPEQGLGYGLGLMATAICAPGELTFGHSGGALGHQSNSFHASDGGRHFSFVYNIDDFHGHIDRAEAEYAFTGLMLAGMCGIDIDDLAPAERSTMAASLEGLEESLL